MSIDGPLKSVYVVNDDELRVNGGRWLLQSGPAIKVRGFDVNTLGGRKVKGGDALPIYILTENDIRPRGGRWLLKAGQAQPMTNIIGSARGVIQGKAIPVYPVDNDGNFDPIFGWAYASKAANIAPGNLVAYWPLWEDQGITAEDISGNNRDGTYVDITLGQPGIGDGRTSAGCNGASSIVNQYSSSLNAGFNGDEGTIIIWLQIPIGAWTDGVLRTILHWAVDGSNEIFLRKNSANNQLVWKKDSGGVIDSFVSGGHANTEFFMMSITWSLANNRMRGYKGPSLEGTAVGIGAWAGNLDPTQVVLATDDTTTPTQNFIDNMAHCACWDRELTQPEIATLSVV